MSSSLEEDKRSIWDWRGDLYIRGQCNFFYISSKGRLTLAEKRGCMLCEFPLRGVPTHPPNLVVFSLVVALSNVPFLRKHVSGDFLVFLDSLLRSSGLPVAGFSAELCSWPLSFCIATIHCKESGTSWVRQKTIPYLNFNISTSLWDWLYLQKSKVLRVPPLPPAPSHSWWFWANVVRWFNSDVLLDPGPSQWYLEVVFGGYMWVLGIESWQAPPPCELSGPSSIILLCLGKKNFFLNCIL